MAWKETCVMDLKIKFISDWLSGRYTKTLLSSKYSISRPTVDKWIARYSQYGPSGLYERSRRPASSPNQTPPAISDKLLALKRSHPHWGPKKINDLFKIKYPRLHCPADSTTAHIFSQAGLVKPRRIKRSVTPYSANLTKSTQPNDVWNIDFKGQSLLGNSQWCYPLTVTDDFSRFLIGVDGLMSTGFQGVHAVMERHFHEFGLPLVIKSDNGVPFASKALAGLSYLSIWFIKLGITPERIAVGKPTQNSRHERMHRTLKAESMNPMQHTLEKQQMSFNQFRDNYNYLRSHEALGRTRPAEHYEYSPRIYVPNKYEINYDLDIEIRKVRHSGEIKWKGQLVYVHSALTGESIGLRQLNDDVSEVYFSFMKIGLLDERQKRIVRLS
ncbi:integrase core domain-containing protein [Vibrio nitrifigilis]|uniref:Transposase n=3 Tax=Vibrio TaxID=662 RepID=A0ABS0GHJ6_9VIBR|nr:integrase core domain-containing protein [Vibrio nitrifigilis]MBF9001907.1 transposase [Vibrio nitrifigilis]